MLSEAMHNKFLEDRESICFIVGGGNIKCYREEGVGHGRAAERGV